MPSRSPGRFWPLTMPPSLRWLQLPARCQFRSPEKAHVVDYPAALEQVRHFPGRAFVSSLNRVRNNFKHAGMLPHVPDWYRVISNTETWVAEWCDVCGCSDAVPERRVPICPTSQCRGKSLYKTQPACIASGNPLP